MATSTSSSLTLSRRCMRALASAIRMTLSMCRTAIGTPPEAELSRRRSAYSRATWKKHYTEATKNTKISRIVPNNEKHQRAVQDQKYKPTPSSQIQRVWAPKPRGGLCCIRDKKRNGGTTVPHSAAFDSMGARNCSRARSCVGGIGSYRLICAKQYSRRT